jgi:nucleoid-associated protein YgaU
MFFRPGIAKELGEENKEKYVEIYIKPGDTLWDLARKFGNSNKDVRKIVFEICEINHLDTLNIYPGQMIKIPTQ